jgi:uncharacterized protein YcbX
MPNTAATTATAIYRYPVKGLSAEKLDRVTLTPGECLPHDRLFRIALGSTSFDPIALRRRGEPAAAGRSGT